MVEKLTSRVIGFIFLLAFGVVMPVTSDVWAGETEDHGRFVGGKVEVQAVKVGDVDGHVVGSYHVTGVNFRNEEISTSFGGGTFDFVNQVGPARGFTVEVFKDGSTITSRAEGEIKLGENKKQYFEGTYQCISGTGRWKGIQCEGTVKESFEENDMSVGEWSGIVTLPD
jgi:hypothetical protein